MKVFWQVFLGIIAAAAVIYIAPRAVRSVHRAATATPWAEENTLMQLRTVNAAEITYSATYPRGFSGSLADLGAVNCGGILAATQDSPKCAGLIPDFLAHGQGEGYSFIYVPLKGRRGSIDHYSVTATPVSWDSGHAVAYFTDDSGVIRLTSQHRQAARSDPPIMPSSPAADADAR